jgi:hypothetical protein
MRRYTTEFIGTFNPEDLEPLHGHRDEEHAPAVPTSCRQGSLPAASTAAPDRGDRRADPLRPAAVDASARRSAAR